MNIPARTRNRPVQGTRLMVVIALGTLMMATASSGLSAQASASVLPGRPVHLSDDLSVRSVATGAWVATHSFPWPANSLVVAIGTTHAILVDTPYTPDATRLLLAWIEDLIGTREILAINTGFHIDNLGGNAALVERGIAVWGSDRTAEMLNQRGEASRGRMLEWLAAPENRRYAQAYRAITFIPPTHRFAMDEPVTLEVAGESVQIIFPGETHAPDNVVVYFPERRLLFGGCMILAGDKPGNTADANMETWADAVRRLEALEPRLVIPGHGLRVDSGLIPHTLEILHRERLE